MEVVHRSLLCLALLGVSCAAARAPVVNDPALRPTSGGALLELSVAAREREGDTLVNVWASGSRAKLLRCQPRCKPVSGIPVSGQLLIGPQSLYRVVLGGSFTPGSRVGLILTFASGNAAVEATVSRAAAFDP